VVTALAEVPTGVVADRFGRRVSLVAATVLVAAGSALVALLHGYGAMAEHARRSCAPVAASE
jgi:MFS family permease